MRTSRAEIGPVWMEGALEDGVLGMVERGVVESDSVLAVTRVTIVYLAAHLQFQTDGPSHTLESEDQRDRLQRALRELTASDPQSEPGL